MSKMEIMEWGSTMTLSVDDLASLVAKRVPSLRRVRLGAYEGLCPFHDERTPSFKLYTDRRDGYGRYHCFGCGAHGGSVKWLLEVEKKTWKEIGPRKPDAALVRERVARHRRERAFDCFLDRYPDACPEWGILFGGTR